jgi:hypothetical protein
VTLSAATGKVTSGSASVTNMASADLAKLYVGESVSGAGIAANTTISAIGTSSITLNHNATASNASDSLTFTGVEFSTSTQAFTSSVSTSSAAWQAFTSVFDEVAAGYHPNTGNSAIDTHQYTVTADGEGLKNALAAFNYGGTNASQGFVLSKDGSAIGWTNDKGVHVSDVHANSPGAFWGILEDQILLGQAIAGIGHV